MFGDDSANLPIFGAKTRRKTAAQSTPPRKRATFPGRGGENSINCPLFRYEGLRSLAMICAMICRPPSCWRVDHFYQLGLNESLTDQTIRGTQPMYPQKAKNQTEGGGFSHRARKRHSKTDDVRVASATGKNQAEAPSRDDTLSHQGMNVEPPTRYERGPKSLFFTHKNVPQPHFPLNPLPISIRYQYGINTDKIRIDSVLIPY